MEFRYSRFTLSISIFLFVTGALADDGFEKKTQSITDTLVILCMAGGSESTLTSQGSLQLRSKIRDVLTGNIGADAQAGVGFSKHVWEGIIGGISKDMTAVQSQQANEARKCMVENGFILINRILASQ